MANKRFRRTEYAIFVAYYKLKDAPSAKVVARRAGISRSTLYRHHQNSQNISRDYEDYLLLMYNRAIKNYLRSKKVPLSFIFFRTLIFILSHREVFKALFLDGHQEIIKKMLGKLKPKITSLLHQGNQRTTAYDVYENEILGVIEAWSRHSFSSSSLNQAFSDILYLTNTAPERLAPLK